MPSFTFSHLLPILIIVYVCLAVPSALGKLSQGTASVSRYRAVVSQTKPAAKVAHDARHNASFTNTTVPVPTTWTLAPARRISDRNKSRSASRNASLSTNKAEAREIAAGKTLAQIKTSNKTATRIKSVKSKTRPRTPTPTKRRRQNDEPTPEPTGNPSTSTTVYIEGENTFALLLPSNSGEMVSDAEQDGIAYCTDGTECGNPFPEGFITGAAYGAAPDGSYVQITGCIDSTRFPFADGDDGGQFDNRFPDGAQCTFGGYGASFIELVEPSANRFCLRCCQSADDQQNCNSHQSRDGCTVAIPGTYEFGEVDCS